MFVYLEPDQVKTVIQIGALALILWFETLFPLFRRGGMNQRLIHIGRNLGLGLFNGLVIALLFSSLTAWATRAAGDFGILAQMNGSAWLENLLAILFFDLWMYLWHRANHRIPFLWKFHRMHHSDNQVDATTALRFHTGELVFSSTLRLAVLPLLGLSLSQLLLYETCLQPIIILHHSNVAIPEKIDRILRTLIVTPNMHRVHHSQVNRETNSNYSSIFSFWDRIGKSFTRRRDLSNLRYGLPDFPEPQWQTFGGMLKTPLHH